MSNSAKWILGISLAILAFFGLFLLVFLFWFFSEPYDDTLATSGERVAIVDVVEPIYSSTEIVRQLKKYRENRAVKAIVLRIESPGGGVASSQEIYEEVKKTRDGGKPVVVSMGEVAASGGFYVACGASTIVANPGTLTGSIGVIVQYIQAEELLKKIGVEASTFKSGRYKDAGSPFRRTTEDDRRLFEQLVADVHAQFVDVVAEERKLARLDVLRIADGRVLTGKQAHAQGLVDTLGTMEDAVAIAARLGGVKGKPKIVKERKTRPFFDRLFGESEAGGISKAVSDIATLKDELLRQPAIQYRMKLP